jgi:tetratricopeptide (TPR) repeat protein
MAISQHQDMIIFFLSIVYGAFLMFAIGRGILRKGRELEKRLAIESGSGPPLPALQALRRRRWLAQTVHQTAIWTGVLWLAILLLLVAAAWVGIIHQGSLSKAGMIVTVCSVALLVAVVGSQERLARGRGLGWAILLATGAGFMPVPFLLACASSLSTSVLTKLEETVNVHRSVSPAEAEGHYSLGQMYFIEGDWAKAVREFHRALGGEPGWPEANHALALAYCQHGEPNKAIPYYQEALRLRPSEPQIHYDLGVTYRVLGRWGEAEEEFAEAVKLDPYYIHARNNLESVKGYRHFQQGIKHGNQGYWEAAVQELQVATQLNPRDPQTHYALGIVYTTLGVLDRALKAFCVVFELQPDLADAYRLAGQIHLEWDEVEDAIAYLETAMALGFDSHRVARELQLAKQQHARKVQSPRGRPQEAPLGMSEVLTNSEMYRDLANNVARGKSSIAEALVKLANIELNEPVVAGVIGRIQGVAPTDPHLAYNLALLLYEMVKTKLQSFELECRVTAELVSLGIDAGDPSCALKLGEQYVVQAQQEGRVEETLALLHQLGSAYCRLGKYERAREAFERGLAQCEEAQEIESDYLSRLGVVYRIIGDYERARDYHVKAWEIRRRERHLAGECESLMNLGIVAYHLGDSSRALGYYGEALRIRHQFEQILLRRISVLRRLADSYAGLGNDDKAGQCQEKIYVAEAQMAELERTRGYILSNMGQALTSTKHRAARKANGEQTTGPTIAVAERRMLRITLEQYQEALREAITFGDKQAQNARLAGLGAMYWALGDYEQAEKYLKQAIAVAEDTNEVDRLCMHLASLGRLYCDDHLAREQEAYAKFEQAIKHLESVRESLSVEMRLFIAEDRFEAYRDIILLGWRMAKARSEVLAYTERARSRVLLDQLAMTAIRVPVGVNRRLLVDEARLLEEARKLAAARRGAKGERFSTLGNQLRDAERQLKEVWDNMQEAAPEYVALRRSTSLTLKEVKTCLQNV